MTPRAIMNVTPGGKCLLNCSATLWFQETRGQSQIEVPNWRQQQKSDKVSRLRPKQIHRKVFIQRHRELTSRQSFGNNAGPSSTSSSSSPPPGHHRSPSSFTGRKLSDRKSCLVLGKCPREMGEKVSAVIHRFGALKVFWYLPFSNILSLLSSFCVNSSYFVKLMQGLSLLKSWQLKYFAILIFT